MFGVLYEKDRNISRFVTTGHSEYSDAPDTARDEGRIAREIGSEIPVLTLLRQNGNETQGWKGAAFYWPVLVTPRDTKTAIFASDVVDED